MHNKKDRTIAGVIVFVTLAIIIILVVIFIKNHSNKFAYDGWIDCMPPLSGSKADLCKQAEAAGYPYIAY